MGPERCEACWWVDGEPMPRRCVLAAGHPRKYPHWKGLCEWTDESTTHDLFHDPGRQATLADYETNEETK